MADEILDDIDFEADNLLEKEEMESYLEIFIGRRSDYYIEYWKNPKKISFDFLKMTIGIPWMLYRKMYYPVFFFGVLFYYILGLKGIYFLMPITGIIFLIAKADAITTMPLIMGSLWLMLNMIIFGFFSREIYLRYAIQQINNYKKKSNSEAGLIGFLEKKGGTEGISLVFFLFIVFNFLLSEVNAYFNTILTF